MLAVVVVAVFALTTGIIVGRGDRETRLRREMKLDLSKMRRNR